MPFSGFEFSFLLHRDQFEIADVLLMIFLLLLPLGDLLDSWQLLLFWVDGLSIGFFLLFPSPPDYGRNL
jgi:hypothetical protein